MPVSENLADRAQPAGDLGGLRDQGDADMGGAGVAARSVAAPEIGPGQHPDPGLAPERARRRLAVAGSSSAAMR